MSVSQSNYDPAASPEANGVARQCLLWVLADGEPILQEDQSRCARLIQGAMDQWAAHRAEELAATEMQGLRAQRDAAMTIIELKDDLLRDKLSELIAIKNKMAEPWINPEWVKSLEEENYNLRELAAIGAKWRENSSLGAWFPFSAEELDNLRKRIHEMSALLERMPHFHDSYNPEDRMDMTGTCPHDCPRCQWDKLKAASS